MESSMRVLKLTLLLICTSPGVSQTIAPLRLEKEILLPGVEGRIDHLSFDMDGQRIFVSALANSTIEVIDLNQGKRVHQIGGLKEPQGVLFDPSSNKLFVACGGDGAVRSYDGLTFTPINSVSLGDDADNLRYDTRKKAIIVGYGGGALASFDSDLNQKSNVKLPSHPESFQLEQKGQLIFVNLPKSFSVDVIDGNRNEIVHSWKEATAFANFPMALDEANHRLFLGYRTPARMIVLNTDDGKVVDRQPIVGDTDDLFFDPSSHRIYVIGGEGFVDVLEQDSADRYRSLGRVQTGSGARTGLFIPGLKVLAVAVPHRGNQTAKLLIFRTE
jgi:DNA-binding beta-propeller fold protein YncE